MKRLLVLSLLVVAATGCTCVCECEFPVVEEEYEEGEDGYRHVADTLAARRTT